MALKLRIKAKATDAQSAVEYLLLLVAVTIVVLLAFKTLLPQNKNSAEGYLNVVAKGIYDRPVNGSDATGSWDKGRAGPGFTYP